MFNGTMYDCDVLDIRDRYLYYAERTVPCPNCNEYKLTHDDNINQFVCGACNVAADNDEIDEILHKLDD